MTTQNEIWRPVVGYEGLYDVSTHGRVRSYKNGSHGTKMVPRLLRTSKGDCGYPQVWLSKDGLEKNIRVHRLVAMAFVPNPHGYGEIDHKDGNKANANVSNLEWVTHSENLKRAYKNGQAQAKAGEDHHNAKLTNADATALRILYESGKYSQRALARMFGVTQPTVGRIVRNEAYTRYKLEVQHDLST